MERYEKLAERPEILAEGCIDLQKMSKEIQAIFREIGSSMEHTLRYESLMAALFEDELEIYKADKNRDVIRGRIDRDFTDLGMNAKERTETLVRLFGSQKLFEVGIEGSEMRGLIARDIRGIVVLLLKHMDELTEGENWEREQLRELKEFLRVMIDTEIPTIATHKDAKKFKEMVADRISRDIDAIPLYVSAKFPTELLSEILYACYGNDRSIGDMDLWATLLPTNDFRTADHPVQLALSALDLRENNPEEYIQGGYGALAKRIGYSKLTKRSSEESH
jgi:hypothetical protein